VSLALEFKSEVVLAAQLVMRHRAPRLAALLVLSVICLALVRTDGDAGGSRIALLNGGVVAAVAASRPLAPGPALACAYRVAASWWLVPAGRLVGTLIVTLPIAGASALVLTQEATSPATLPLGLVTVVYAAALASLILAVTPILGSSFAAALGFLTAWFGTAPPSAVHIALQKWPAIQGAGVLVWNALPLNWRAVRWLREAREVDVLLLLAWSCVGIAGAAWTISAAYRSHRPPDGTPTA